jgi:hypothetical protein
VGIDQVWFSDVDQRERRFSDFAYQHISYDLFLEGWVESVPRATKEEISFLKKVPMVRELLRECLRAAQAAKNSDMVPLIAKANEFVDALERAILFRFETAEIDPATGQPRKQRSFMPESSSRLDRRIHPLNYSLLRELPEDHPAVVALKAHADAREACAAAGIGASDPAVPVVDQEWISDIDGSEHTFSSIAKDSICHNLFLDGWVERDAEATEAEISFLDDAPRMRVLLDECESAAQLAGNSVIMPLVTKARDFIDAMERAVLYRDRIRPEAESEHE